MRRLESTGLGLVGMGLLLAIGAITSAVIVTRTAREVTTINQTIDVMGSAEKVIQSDIVHWRSAITARGADRVTAYDKLEADSVTLIAFLEKSGLSKDEIKISATSTNPVYAQLESGATSNEVSSYIATRSIEVTSKNLAVVTALASEHGELIRGGMEFESYPPEYFYSELSPLKTSMLAEAVKNARERAEQFAKGSNMRVGPMRGARQGVFQVTAPNSGDMSDSGVSDTSTVDKNIKAVVAVQYSILP